VCDFAKKGWGGGGCVQQFLHAEAEKNVSPPHSAKLLWEMQKNYLGVILN
jgi:hypothetical protein